MRGIAVWVLALAMGGPLCGQRPITLKQAVDLALQRNPELTLARLDARRTQLEVEAAREPLMPKLSVGSGLAYTYGYPLSIEGSAPSIIDVAATRSIYDPQRGHRVAQAKENARGAELQSEATREDVALRVAMLFLDLERAVKAGEVVARQEEHLRRVEASVRLRIEEGRELPLEGKRAAVAVLKARQRREALESSRRRIERTLNLALGLDAATPLVPAMEDRPAPVAGDEPDAAVARALEDNQEVRRLESAVKAKEFEARTYLAARLPRITFVAKYGLFGRYNNFEDYFLRFQRNNGLAGASFQLPLFANREEEARAAQAAVEQQKLRVQISQVKGRIEAETRQTLQRVQDAELAREVARMDLELSRDQTAVLLAQMTEGRASLRQVEEARFAENERWLAVVDAQYEWERAHLELQSRTRTLLASLR